MSKKEKPRYAVIVGNIGTVYDGNDKVYACGLFAQYRDDSAAGVGRGAYESVVMMQDDEIWDEYLPQVSFQLQLIVDIEDGQHPSTALVAAALEHSTASEALSEAIGAGCRLVLAKDTARALAHQGR